MISIIIPTYNESKNLEKLIPLIKENLFSESEIIVVDDSENPKEVNKLVELQWRYRKDLLVWFRGEKLGIGSAYREAASNVRGNIIVFMDGDLSHNPEHLNRMIGALKENDLVIGSRYVRHGEIEGWNWKRKILSKGANNLSRLFLGMPINDLTSGYRAFRKELIDSIDFNSVKSNGYSFILETNYLAWKKKARIKEVPITFKQRINGNSKLGKKEILNYLLKVIELALISREAKK